MNTNSGDCNTGDYNVGNYNSGHYNVGNYNSGHWNSGNWNSGNRNSGDWNSGNRNSGHWNSGDYNNGDCNSGDWNSGDYNSGDWNSGDYNNGCFNTESPKIFLFNKLSDWTYQDWLKSDARDILTKCPLNVFTWINKEVMTDEEKRLHPEYSTTGGFLKYIKKESKRQEWWNNLSSSDKDAVMSLPNFDKEIFREITGIDVEI